VCQAVRGTYPGCAQAVRGRTRGVPGCEGYVPGVCQAVAVRDRPEVLPHCVPELLGVLSSRHLHQGHTRGTPGGKQGYTRATTGPQQATPGVQRGGGGGSAVAASVWAYPTHRPALVLVRERDLGVAGTECAALQDLLLHQLEGPATHEAETEEKEAT